MVNRAFKAIRRADVVLLMVDVEAGITDQVHSTARVLAVYENVAYFGVVLYGAARLAPPCRRRRP